MAGASKPGGRRHKRVALARGHFLGLGEPGQASTRQVDVPDVAELMAGIEATVTVGEALARDEVDPLDTDQRRFLIDQLITCLDLVYVHRDMKKTRHAVDPAAALRRLRRNADKMPALDFHLSIMAAFKSLRDQHTAYILPQPWQDMIAFLPFMLGGCEDADDSVAVPGDGAGAPPGDTHGPGDAQDDPSVIVTNVLEGFEHPHFRPGVEVLTWNGMPVGTAVRRVGRQEQASNRYAEFALGVRLLTVRWLGGSLPPEEYFVTIGYIDPDAPDTLREIRFGWGVKDLAAHREAAIQGAWDMARFYTASDSPLVSIDQRSMIETMEAARAFPDRAESKRTEAYSSSGTGEVPRMVLRIPRPLPMPEDQQSAFRSSIVTVTGEGFGHTFGLIRIVHFEQRKNLFLENFRALLKDMPKGGLAIDIRSNPGGEIEAAEGILQTLTDHHITPLPFQFLANSLTEELATPDHGWQKMDTKNWLDLIRPAADMGSQFSRFGHMSDEEEINSVGRVYNGPVVLITNAVTYSSGDIFAASFQDHEIGEVIGVDPSTGGGGANMWPMKTIVDHDKTFNTVQGLPGSAYMHMAVRRCIRVGRRFGLPIEEAGVTPDILHAVTRRDLLKGDVDLMEHIARRLATKTKL